MKGEKVKAKLKTVFGLLVKIVVVIVLTILLLEGGVRVVLYVSLNNYLTKVLPQPYGNIMQKVGRFDCFGAKSENQFDPLCYFIPQTGFFRGPEGRVDCPKEKTNHEIRIICIGDSATYGVAVDYDHSWVVLLGRMLTEKYPGKNIRVLNAGLPGATSRQVKRFFQFYIAPYHPDILIWRGGSTLTDTYFVNAATDSMRFLMWRCLYESRLLRVICALLDRGKKQLADKVFDFVTNKSGRFLLSPLPSGAFDSDFSLVKRIAEERGTQYVLQVEHLNRDETTDTIYSEFEGQRRDDKKPVAYTLAAFEAYRKKNPSKNLFVDHVHLTETGEAITAEEISKFIINNKWIETLN
ncbi:MAG: GDSL-type esterase/lipase family protein [Candidatus Omnitrophota bacterium]